MPTTLRPGVQRTATTAARPAAPIDFDLHGMAGIRLVDATAADHRVVRAQLGPMERPLTREPDLRIRFVDRLEPASPERTVAVGESAYDDDSFLLLRSRHKARTRVRIPFDQLGQPCEIVCERGLAAVPLLLGIINLAVLARGGLALHATAFRWEGRGILVTGWSKSGKTETLLAFLEHGAEYIGDEWIYLDPDGSSMAGVPEPMRLWDWQFAQLPAYRRLIGRGDRARLRSLRIARSALAASATLAGRRARRSIDRALALIDRQRYAFVKPERLSSDGRPKRARVDHVVFLSNAAVTDTVIESVSPAWIAARMVHSLAEERAPLSSFYRQYRFAFPQRPNPFLEAATDLEARRLPLLLAGRPCHAVHHRYPPAIRGLFDDIAPLITATAPLPTHRP